MMSTDDKWHLDKKVPISIIVVLLVYLLGGLWFLSKIESRVIALEVAAAQQQMAQVRVDDRQDREAIANVILTREALNGVNAKLDRLIERRR